MSPPGTTPTTPAESSAPPASWVVEQLCQFYGRPERQPPMEPIDELIMTVLSQNTSDVNTERAFRSLTARFKDWDEVAQAPPGQVVDAIHAGGLANTKGPRIQQILQIIHRRLGSYDLGFLKTLSMEEATDWLTALPGVGPKTAACVLLFSLGRPALPVDTHVLRVSHRLGLTPGKPDAQTAQQILEAQIPEMERYAAHMLFIRHGRTVCKARRPRCPACVLNTRCPSSSLGEAS